MPAPFCPPSFPVRHRLLRGGWCGGALAVLLLAGCGKQETKPEADVLARGVGWTIRTEDFRHWWTTRPGPADSPQARTEVLGRLKALAAWRERVHAERLRRLPA